MVVIAAVDRTGHARAVAAEAATLAEAFDEDLHVVHVLSNSEFLELEDAAVKRTGTAMPIEAIRETAARFAENGASEIEGEYTAVGLVGSAGSRVVDYADKAGARFVVVGPRKRSPAGKALLGSTAQSIILNASCPVVSVVEAE